MKTGNTSIMLALALLSLTGCSSASPNHVENTAVSVQSTGLSVSSEKNQQLAAIEMSSTSAQTKGTEAPPQHITYLSMNRELADQLMQAAHLGSTAVAMTDTHIYVAVDLGESKENAPDKHAKELSKTNDPSKEAGLFGSGMGAQMDWITAKPIPIETTQAIRHLLTRIYPDSKVYISSNSLFVNRMMYYDMQQRGNKRMDMYLNEFNTMVQYAFPVGQ